MRQSGAALRWLETSCLTAADFRCAAAVRPPLPIVSALAFALRRIALEVIACQGVQCRRCFPPHRLPATLSRWDDKIVNGVQSFIGAHEAKFKYKLCDV